MTNHVSMAMILKSKPNHSSFATIEEIMEKSKGELLALTNSAFQKGFEDWKKLWGFTLKRTIYLLTINKF